MKIGVIADDLTGAADSVAPFAGRGLAAEVRFFRRGMTLDCEADAIAIDTGSRDSPMNDTLRDLTLRRAARAIAACQPTVVFKKIDSALRGHLRVDLDAMRAVLPERLPIVCPAFPANGRIVRDGALWIHGERQPISVRTAFQYGEDEAARATTLTELRRGGEALAARFDALRNNGAACVFCDAETDADLDILAEAVILRPAHLLPVGSAGLSSAFARRFPVSETEIESAAELADETAALLNAFKTGRVLIVIGSLHEVSRNQLRHFSERTGVIPIVPEVDGEFDTLYQRITPSFQGGQRIVTLATPETRSENLRIKDGIESLLITAHKMWAGNKQTPFDALFVTGGDSAKETLRSLNGNGLQLTGELGPGIALGQLTTNEAGSQIFCGLPILLKSGGFGTLNLIATLTGLD